MTPLAPSTVVGGDFRVVRPLSAGGMGAVYVAEQLSTGKQRALKIMHAQLRDDPKQRKRFVREARIAASIESRHVVEVISAGVETDSGVPWIAMELLAGCDLAELIEREGPLPIARVQSILEHICHALGAAHDAGIVHRDMKPQNVFLAEQPSHDSDWVVKVLDFGIAKVMAQATLSPTVAMGSPAWMAPEQGETNPPISPATDVWALGLLVFWMLTGRIYWLAANDETSSLQALMKELLFAPLVIGSTRAEALGVEELWPSRLDPWLACCLVHEPEERFVDAHELLAAFSVALEDEDAPASQQAVNAADAASMTALLDEEPLSDAPAGDGAGGDVVAGDAADGAEPRAPRRDGRRNRRDAADDPAEQSRARSVGGGSEGMARRARQLRDKSRTDLHSATGGPMALAPTQPAPQPPRWRNMALVLALLGAGGLAVFSQLGPGPVEVPPARGDQGAAKASASDAPRARRAALGGLQQNPPGSTQRAPAGQGAATTLSSAAASASAVASASASASAVASGSASAAPLASVAGSVVAAPEGSPSVAVAAPAPAGMSPPSKAMVSPGAAPAESAKPRYPPFNSDEAQRLTAQAARLAGAVCKKAKGERDYYSASFRFSPNGRLTIVLTPSTDTPRASCVRGQLMNAAMGPFDGDEKRILSQQVSIR